MSLIFPKWFNVLPTALAVGSVGGLGATIVGTWYWATPDFFEVGYMPTQPGSGYNHQIHTGKLGMDCRYCHTKVEKSPEANVPNVATCYGCHKQGRVDSMNTGATDAKVQFIRDAYEKDESIPWRRVHKLPGYVRNFPHNIHVAAGVSCFSCHGQIKGMPEVYQAYGIGMGWCLDCHRDVKAHPERHLVPLDKVTQLEWVQEHFKNVTNGDPEAKKWLEERDINAPENCGACHY
jgi:Cytochrome c7 and related cytochrome c